MRSLIFSKLYHNDNLELCKPMYSLDLIVFAVCGDSHIYIFIYCFMIIHHASPFQPVYFYVKENITFIKNRISFPHRFYRLPFKCNFGLFGVHD